MEVVKLNSQSRLSKSVENVLAMKGGHGDSSYAFNSAIQMNMVQAMKPILERCIYENMRRSSFLKLKLMNNGGGLAVLRIADLGCATGWNTLLVADTIVKAVRCSVKEEILEMEMEMEMDMEMEMPEFEVYFTDLPSNDFNSLFRMLPKPDSADADADDDDNKLPVAKRCYFAAAVCGSYFRRLFPRKSLHVCHSSLSLHWLSGVPESETESETESESSSGGHVYISSESEGNAYLQQFDTDLTAFLKARAEEMVGGGCMFIALVGRNAGAHILKEQGTLGDIARQFDYAFQELVNEGIIEKEKWESFKMPYFGPTPEEVESIVKREGSFGIESVRALGGFPLHPMTQVRKGEEDMFGASVANHYRTLFENIVKAHLGCEQSTNEVFSRIGKRAAAKKEEYLSNKIEVVVAFLLKK